MNKVHVIVNPLSARGKTQERWQTLKEIFKHHFKEFKYMFTEQPLQAIEVARECLRNGFDLIIGVGGDGTLNEITNGFLHPDTNKAINEEASLGIVPSGTGSDFIRYLKIPRDFRKSVALIKNSIPHRIDVGKITYNPDIPGQARASRCFINVADFGLGAQVIKNISAIPAAQRTALLYYKGLLSTIKTYRSTRIRIEIDDSEILEDNFLIGAVANGRMFGGGMIIAPEALIDDGQFDLVVIPDMTRLEVIWNSRLLYNGKILKHPKVTYRKAKKIRVSSAAPVDVEFDGELGIRLPVELEVLEKAVNLRI